MIIEYGILNAAKYFYGGRGSQYYLILQPVIIYFKPVTNGLARPWKSIGLTA